MRTIKGSDLSIFFRKLYDLMFEADLFSRAAQSAFYLAFSIFPFLLFLTSLFGLVLDSSDGIKNELILYLRQVMPATASELVSSTLAEIAVNSSSGKLTIGLLITLWSASSGVNALRAALNAVYQLAERRSWLLLRIHSLGLTLALCILSAIVLAIVFYGWQFAGLASQYFGMPIPSPYFLVVIQWVSILVLMLLVCELIYNLLPDHITFEWEWVTSGSIVAIVLWLVLTGLFRLYLHYFNSYDRTYGSLGAVIILLLWLYLTALTVMIGGAINTVLRQMRDEHRKNVGLPPDQTVCH
ncbi:MAG: YihY/virulence factor BrkB family protein [Acidobacteria bacterium ACB1]|nr:YihY/virulence factor BrkB family protein [Acidobacteria bacterium ACB1]